MQHGYPSKFPSPAMHAFMMHKGMHEGNTGGYLTVQVRLTPAVQISGWNIIGCRQISNICVLDEETLLNPGKRELMILTRCTTTCWTNLNVYGSIIENASGA